MNTEHSESGAPIIRHQERKRDFEVALGDPENIGRISSHIEKHIGPVDAVFHERLSDLVHVDIHIVAPSEKRPWHTLVTSGMSNRPMTPPAECQGMEYSELMICLPPWWPMGEEAWNREENYWPVRLLKFLARFPHAYQTWLWAFHTIPNGNPPRPFASNTKMNGAILFPPLTAGEGFHTLKVDDAKTIYFHAVAPLHEDEMNFKLQKGAEALFDELAREQVLEILEPGRASVLRRKRSWFSFWRK